MRPASWARWSRSCGGSDGSGPIRIRIRVKPGAGRTRVGGRYGDDELIIAVQEPAVDGRATLAALHAAARALGCRPSAVRLVTGATSRTKVIDVPDDCADLVRALLES